MRRTILRNFRMTFQFTQVLRVAFSILSYVAPIQIPQLWFHLLSGAEMYSSAMNECVTESHAMVMDTALTMEPPSPVFVKMVGMAPLVTGIRMFAAGEHTNVKEEPHV